MKSVRAEGAPLQKGRTRGKRPSSSPVAHKTAHTLSATQAERTFSDLLNRVRYRGEAFVIERGGEPVCEISPVKPPRFTGADLAALLRSLPKPDAGFWDAVEEATRQES